MLGSPLPAQEVAARLSQQLRPRGIFSEGFVGNVVENPGVVPPTWSVEFSNIGIVRNSWRYVFKGIIGSGVQGSWITGDVGPNEMVFGFAIFWLSFVSLFFVGGLIGLFTDVVTGHGISYLPLVLVPLAMIIFFFALCEIGSRWARANWEAMELWITELVESPKHP